MYEVAVRVAEKPPRVPSELKAKLKGLSPRLVSRMSREVVECPVLGREVSFLECYSCPNFVRRVKGVVHCRGRKLS